MINYEQVSQSFNLLKNVLRTASKLENPKTFNALIRELPYAEDTNIVALFFDFMERSSFACLKFGLIISLKKKQTKIIYYPVHGEPHVDLDIFVTGSIFVVDTFVYSGSVIFCDGNLDSSVTLWLTSLKDMPDIKDRVYAACVKCRLTISLKKYNPAPCEP